MTINATIFDLALNGGYVIDPRNKISSILNIGIKDGKIATLSANLLRAKETLDIRGLTVAPGFVDLHMHEDPYNEATDSFEFCIAHSMLRMGVTTMISGNCGIGPACSAEYIEAVNRKGYPSNIGFLANQESLCKAAGYTDKYAPVDEKGLAKMADFLEKELDAGCVGCSMGLEYMPGTDREEILTIMKVVKKKNKLFTVHQRKDAQYALESVEEVISCAKETGVSLQISHLASMCGFGNMEAILSTIDSARASGQDIGFDVYPYYAFCTYIGSAVFDEGFLANFGLGDEGYEKIQATYGPLAGKRFTKETFLAQRKEMPDALAVAYVLKEDEVDRVISHPASIVISDGIYSNRQGHPRGSGAFPKLISEYVRERKLLSLENAIEKITDLPAKRLGLTQKGHLTPGADADLVIFNYETIKDGATYEEPLLPPKGIEYVIIGGKIVLKNNTITSEILGKPIILLNK